MVYQSDDSLEIRSPFPSLPQKPYQDRLVRFVGTLPAPIHGQEYGAWGSAIEKDIS